MLKSVLRIDTVSLFSLLLQQCIMLSSYNPDYHEIKERSDHHLAQILSVLDDRRDEPGEVELEVFELQVGPLGEQQ